MMANYALSDIVERHAFTANGRDRVALALEGANRTFAQLNERSRRLANALRGKGVKPGDRVAVLMGNGHEWPEALFAITSIGAVCVPVNVLLNGRDVAHVISDSGAVALIADKTAARALDGLADLPPIRVWVEGAEAPGDGWNGYEALISRASDAAGAHRPMASDPAMMYYTSGTTGKPKGAVHSHAGVLWNSYHQIGDINLTDDDVYLLVPSLSWAAGFHDVMLGLMWRGGRTVMLPTGGLTIERIVDAIERCGATRVLLVPTLLKQLCAAPEAFERLRKTRLRRIYTGGEVVPPVVVERINSELPNSPVIQMFGMSEFPLMMTLMTGEDSMRLPNRAGRPSSITSIAVRDKDGIIRPEGDGEVLIRSCATMIGYHNRPEETAEALRDGWFHTGDMGRIDGEGFLMLTGRAKDMIISGGMNVYPREIEDIIQTIEGVREVAVVGVPDEKWGEAAVAVVVADASVDIDAAVRSLCERELSSYKRPRAVLVRQDGLPRTPTGKVLKRELRPWAETQLKD